MAATLNDTLGVWAYRSGLRKVYSMVADFGPGHDAEAAFQQGFKAAGGEIVGSVRFPVANPDFSAYVQRAKDVSPQGIYIWIPGGAMPGAVRRNATSADSTFGRGRKTSRETEWKPVRSVASWRSTETAP